MCKNICAKNTKPASASRSIKISKGLLETSVFWVGNEILYSRFSANNSACVDAQGAKK